MAAAAPILNIPNRFRRVVDGIGDFLSPARAEFFAPALPDADLEGVEVRALRDGDADGVVAVLLEHGLPVRHALDDGLAVEARRHDAEPHDLLRRGEADRQALPGARAQLVADGPPGAHSPAEGGG